MSARYLLSIATLLLAPVVGAQTLQLDPNFHATVANGTTGQVTAIQPDGKVLANGASVRYNVDGSVDSSYAPTALPSEVDGAAVAFDGKIVVWSAYTTAKGGSSVVQLNADGSLDVVLSKSIQPLGTLTTVTLQSDGKVVVNGTVTLQGLRHDGLVRLNRDGSVDTTFDDGMGPSGGGVAFVAQQADMKLIVGGYFDHFDGLPEPKLARLNSDGTVDQTFFFTPGTNATPTSVVALPTGKLAVGIFASGAGGTANLERINSDGTLDLVYAPASGAIGRLALQPDGQVLAIGPFGSGGTATTTGLFRFNLDGTLDTSFAAVAADYNDLAGIDSAGRIYLDRNNNSFVRLTVDGQPDASFAAASTNPAAILAIAPLANGGLVAIGQFVTLGGTSRAGIAILRADGSADPSFAPTVPLAWQAVAGASVNAASVAALPNGSVVAAGTFILGGAQPRNGLARFNADGSVDPTFNPVLNSGGQVSSVAALPDGRTVIGGTFTTVNGQPRGNLAAFLADGTLDTSFAAAAATNGSVSAFASRPNGGLFVAGTFSTVGGARREILAALTSTGQLDTSFAPTSLTSTDTVEALAASADGGVFIGAPKAPNTQGFARAQIRHLWPTGDVDSTFVFPLDVNAQFASLAADASGGVYASYLSTEDAWQSPPTFYGYLHHFTASGHFDAGGTLAPVTGNGNSATLVAPIATAADGSLIAAGSFTSIDGLATSQIVRVTQITSPGAGHLANISTRCATDTGANVLIAGFVVTGSQPKTVLLRAVGPDLASNQIAGFLPHPALTLYRAGNSQSIGGNAGWKGYNPAAQFGPSDVGANVAATGQLVGAFPLGDPNDAALVVTLAPGAYTMLTTGAANTPQTGVALVEVYDADSFAGDRQLVNISSRGHVDSGDNVLIAGFVITGNAPAKVLLRGIGPTLATQGVDSPLSDPVLELHAQSTGAIVAQNDDWGGGSDLMAAFAATGAFSLPANSKDSALLVTLSPGAYSIVVRGANGATGVGLAEVYAVP